MGGSLAYLVAAVWLAAPGPAAGSGAPLVGASEPEQADAAPDEQTARRGLLLFPVDDPHRDGLAGPHRRGLAVTWLEIPETDVADTGNRYFGLHLGGRFGVLRVHPADRPDRGWQIGIEAGFYGQFDINRSYDNIGWDGFYGLALTGALGKAWALKVGVLHTSSHVGDEYAERTGRRRIGYTREELLAGVTRSIGRRWRVQVEAGWAYGLRNEALQEPGRLRLGLEHLASETLWNGRQGWYAAVDASAVEERDWRLDWAVDIGLLLSPWPRRWRLGLQYYDGRVPLGEFFQNNQRHLGFGLWLDL